MATLNGSFPVSDADKAWTIISDLNKLVPDARVISADSAESVKAEIEVKMGSMGMKSVGPSRSSRPTRQQDRQHQGSGAADAAALGPPLARE